MKVKNEFNYAFLKGGSLTSGILGLFFVFFFHYLERETNTVF